MNKYFSALCITVCFSCVACGSNETNVNKYTTEELLEYSETNKVLLERQNILEEITKESLSSTSAEWIVSAEKPIIALAQEDKAYVIVKVITSQIIPRVADDICQPVVDAITGMGYEQYSITILHSSNLKNEDASGASWETKDGITGIFADNEREKVVFQSGVTIDDLYSYYDNFGSENTNDTEK